MGATSWHQDGKTHWNPEDGSIDPEHLGCHGFSFHAAFTECTVEQCLWVVPGSHRQNRFTKENRSGLKRAGGMNPFSDRELERLPDAAPMLMKPGDVGIHNRSALHGAFLNKSPTRRITMQFGFFNRRYLLGVRSPDP